MHVYCAQFRCVLFRWEYDPKETQCEQEWVCIASVEILYEKNLCVSLLMKISPLLSLSCWYTSKQVPSLYKNFINFINHHAIRLLSRFPVYSVSKWAFKIALQQITRQLLFLH